VKNWTLAASSTPFADNMLMKTTITDPNGNKSIVFKDKLGRAVLSRKTDANATAANHADTYTVYDDKSRVATVIPPDVTYTTDSELIFKYAYDNEDKLLTKKVPDAAAVDTRYNNRDLPALTSVPHLKKVIGTQYDLYGRPTKTGFVAGTAINAINADNFSISEVLSQTAYDGFVIGATTPTYTTPIYKGKPTHHGQHRLLTNDLAIRHLWSCRENDRQ
jgi:hypothetical protein